jgi:hypothetical protein
MFSKTIKTTMSSVRKGLDEVLEDFDNTFEKMAKSFDEVQKEVEKAIRETTSEHTLTEEIEVYGKDEQACIDAANKIAPSGYKLTVIEQRPNIWAAKLRRETKATF